jgi:hypothetical protein
MTTQRNPFWPDVSAETGPNTRFALKIAQDAIQQHDDALVELHSQLNTVKASIPPVTHVISQSSFVPLRPPVSSLTWYVNHQYGDYLLQDYDRGCLVLEDCQEAATVTLNNALKTPWFGAIRGINEVTLKPQRGQINRMDSLLLEAGKGVWVFFDGQDWWTVP